MPLSTHQQMQHNLKSNMDRFIVQYSLLLSAHDTYLKSNMDRFIALISNTLILRILNLKSNMDRFIDRKNG